MELLVAGIAAGAVAGIIVVMALWGFFSRQQASKMAVYEQKVKSAYGEQDGSLNEDNFCRRVDGPVHDTEDDEILSEFGTREEEIVHYQQHTEAKDSRLRQRRTGSLVHQGPPPPYSPSPPEYNGVEHLTHEQATSRTFTEQSDKTIPKSFKNPSESKPKESVIAHETDPEYKEQSESSDGLPAEDRLTQVSSTEGTGTEAEQNQMIPADVEQPQAFKEIKVPVIKVDSATDTFPFEVDKTGCRIEAPYCKLNFPPEAAKQSLHIKMSPDYNYEIKESKIQICPTINFSSDDEMIFDKKVTIELHTSYAAIPNKEISVQVIRREKRDSLFQVYRRNLRHRTERFIAFDVDRFCGFSAEVDESEFKNMQKHYYSAVYMKKPVNDTDRYLHWLVYDDCPGIISERLKYLKQRNVVIDPEVFPIRYNHNLQLGFDGRDVTVHTKARSSPFSEKWGGRINESFQFKISRPSPENLDSEITYQILARHARTQDPKRIMEKDFFLVWEKEEGTPGTVINVTGTGATGMSYNYGERREVERNLSQISNASSGIGSMTNESRIEEAETPVEQEEDDLYGMPTMPKPEYASFSSTEPKSQSTPVQHRAMNNLKELESVGSSERSFTQL